MQDDSRSGVTSPDKARLEQIAEEIIRMFEEDQDAIKNKLDSREDVVRLNTTRLKEIIAEIGWPTTTLVGAASFKAWLLAQHSDHDLEFQKQCLELMKAEPAGVLPENIAYLEDRVRVNEGRQQLYGTQFYTDDDGVFGPRPIEDPDRLEVRRKEAGMGPFSEYEKKMFEVSGRA